LLVSTCRRPHISYKLFHFLCALILPWLSLLVFSPLLPIVHGFLSNLDVFQTNWSSPLLSPFNYQLNPFSQLLFNWTFSLNYYSDTLTFSFIYCSIVTLLLPFFQLLLNFYPFSTIITFLSVVATLLFILQSLEGSNLVAQCPHDCYLACVNILAYCWTLVQHNFNPKYLHRFAQIPTWKL